jgi:PAS domain S-box-containing protein
VVDKDDRFRLVNPAWEQAYGLTQEAAFGQRPDRLLPREVAKFLQTQTSVARRSGQSPRGELVLRVGGKKRVFWSVAFPLPGPDGQRGVAGAVAVEMTELRDAEAAVRQSEENYRTLFESSPHPMWVVAPDGQRFLAVNAAALNLYGYARDEFLRLPASALAQDGDGPDSSETGLTHRSVTGRLRQRHRTKDGQAIEVEVAALPILYDAQGAHLVMAIDVTERRKLEEQLRQAQKMEAVGRLAGGVAHDFNNLLTVINGNAELLGQCSPNEREAATLLKDIREAGDRAAGLVRQLLTFSRRQPTRVETIDLGRVVSGLLGMFRRLLGPRITIRFDPPAETVTVMADRGQLEQVVVNLAVNARDAMPEGGVLELSVSRVGDRAHLVVSDSGCGMTTEVKRRIFEPFFTTKGPDKGTGLGLATVYGIVQQAGGEIEVQSALGFGTTFQISLPMCAAPYLTQVAQPSAPNRNGRALSVLLVDDEEVVRSFATAVLRAGGHMVTEVCDGESALQLLGTGTMVDVLVTDLTMPGLGGWELAGQVRAIRPGIGIVLSSGYAPEGESMATQIDGVFLAKPFPPVALLRAIDEVVAEMPQSFMPKTLCTGEPAVSDLIEVS